ncbi:hypothetical protein [Glutamicibacter sp. PS]|uniref:AMIN-like domain-containing (lipo)protein n=1 Tax=Glutamicibacter sp. PS TaxID=3075634 RepID=UPI002852BB3F|nr:hypothetical protein [Glutamicibacter sp. PS]
MGTMHRAIVAMVAAVGLAASTAPAVATVPAPTGGCSTVYWGSLPKTSTAVGYSRLTDLRTGSHSCFDRLVLDLSGSTEGYSVRYVDQLTGIGSGLPVETIGGAQIEIRVDAPASWSLDVDPAVQRLYYHTFRQLVWLGSFEGQSKVGLSVRARLPMRVFTLDGPGDGSRLVIDVARNW